MGAKIKENIFFYVFERKRNWQKTLFCFSLEFKGEFHITTTTLTCIAKLVQSMISTHNQILFFGAFKVEKKYLKMLKKSQKSYHNKNHFLIDYSVLSLEQCFSTFLSARHFSLEKKCFSEKIHQNNR